MHITNAIKEIGMDNNLRDKILETSIELFNKKGYAYVTLRDISDALNISPII